MSARAAALSAALALTLAATLGVALASAAGATNARLLALPGAVRSISADGGLVALREGPSRGRKCDSASFWKPSSGSLVEVLGEPCGTPYRIQGLALAGTTAIWWDYDTGNHVYCEDVYTATLARPKAEGLGLCDGTQGDTYYEFAGDRTIVAIADYSVCEADCTDENGNLLPDGDYGVEVRKLVGGKVSTVLPPVDFRKFLDARNWRVAVIEPKGVLAVYDTNGKRIWKVAGVAGVTDGWISGTSVVVRRGRSIQAYTPAGAAGVARTLPRGAHVGDVSGGLVVYTAGSSVRLLRLSDGRDAQLVTVKGLVGAQVTPAGIFYAANTRTAGRTRGAVTFVPLSVALRALA
jgi:hypothetical protein